MVQIKNFVLSYDLIDKKDYKKLIDELVESDAKRITESTWLIDADGEAEDVLEHFLKFVDNDDKLFVSEIGPSKPQHKNGEKDGAAWIRKQFPTRDYQTLISEIMKR